jgi:hypothetical protein
MSPSMMQPYTPADHRHAVVQLRHLFDVVARMVNDRATVVSSVSATSSTTCPNWL